MRDLRARFFAKRLTVSALRNYLARLRRRGHEWRVSLLYSLVYFKIKRIKHWREQKVNLENIRIPDSVFWLVPWGVTKDYPFELTPELIKTYDAYTEFCSCEKSIAYYDLDSSEICNIKLVENFNNKSNVCFFVYGPNADQIPHPNLLVEFIEKFSSLSSKLTLICILTDAHLKRHELFVYQLGISWNLIVGLDRMPRLKNKDTQVIGPSVAPISAEKASLIDCWIRETSKLDVVAICGTPYAERIQLAEKLRFRNIPYDHIGALYGTRRLTDEEYWRKQIACSIQVCLLNSYTGEGFHLKGHFSESLMSGCLTIVNNKEVIPDRFQEGVHYLYCPSLDGIVSLIEAIISGKDARDFNSIAREGRKRYLELALSNSYWENLLQDLS